MTLMIFDFSEDTNLFINERLYSYYNMPWNNCKKLWGKKLIYDYFTSNQNTRYGIREIGNVHTVTHTMDFKKNFPDIDINDL